MMIYCKLQIYSTTRSRNIFVSLFHYDLCISYDRVLEITKNIYKNLRESYKKEKFFLPKILKKWLFTVIFNDNIDINAKANFTHFANFRSILHSPIQDKRKLRNSISRGRSSKEEQEDMVVNINVGTEICGQQCPTQFFLIFEIISSHLEMKKNCWRKYLILFKTIRKTLKQLHRNGQNNMLLWYEASCILLE